MVQTTNSNTTAKAEIEAQEALKKRAARQASKRELAPTEHPQVECVVLPQGDGKVSMGQHVAGLGEVHFEEDETFTADLPIAIALYERGYINFPGAREEIAKLSGDRQAEARAEARAKEAQDKALAGL